MLPFKSNTEIRTEGISPEQDVAVGGKRAVLAATAKAVAVSCLDTFSSLRWKVGGSIGQVVLFLSVRSRVSVFHRGEMLPGIPSFSACVLNTYCVPGAVSELGIYWPKLTGLLPT